MKADSHESIDALVECDSGRTRFVEENVAIEEMLHIFLEGGKLCHPKPNEIKHHGDILAICEELGFPEIVWH